MHLQTVSWSWVFENSFAKVKDTELVNTLRVELSGIANWAVGGLRRLRSNSNRFTIRERGWKAQQELAEAQSPALRSAKECLIATGDETDAVPLAVAFKAYEHCPFYVESMSGREKQPGRTSRPTSSPRCGKVASASIRGRVGRAMLVSSQRTVRAPSCAAGSRGSE